MPYSIFVGNVNVRQQQKKDLISTKEQFTKLKSIPADNVSINQHQMEILHITEE